MHVYDIFVFSLRLCLVILTNTLDIYRIISDIGKNLLNLARKSFLIISHTQFSTDNYGLLFSMRK